MESKKSRFLGDELILSSDERYAVTIENINCQNDDHVEDQSTEASDLGQYIKKYLVEKN